MPLGRPESAPAHAALFRLAGESARCYLADVEESWARVAVVVEDDEDIRELIMLTLQQAGFTVHPAATGAQGVALTKTHTPDVITVDVSLPDIDGIEVTRRLRTFSSAVVVMVSARGEEADTLLGLEGGADEYVTKPFRPRELRARIEALLRRAAHTATTTEPAPAPQARGESDDASPHPHGAGPGLPARQLGRAAPRRTERAGRPGGPDAVRTVR